LKKTYLSLSFACLVASFLMLPVVKAGSNSSAKTSAASVISPVVNTVVNAVEAAGIRIYDSLQLDDMGLSRDAFMYAFKGQQNLSSQGKLDNSDILTVCDLSQPSTQKRMYIVDVKNLRVLLNTYVAHGRNSGLEFAEKFSNKVESLQSSLGFYVTKQTYFGKHGLSLRLSGLDRGFNDNAEKRAVVVHGAPYIGENRADAAYMGRSFGCPAVPQAQSTQVINLIKNGTCLFMYHPSETYVHKSTVLNS